MKIKEIIHDNTIAFTKLSPVDKVILDTIHQLQEQVEMLMAEYEKTKLDVAKNTTYTKKEKYHVPWGDFKTYSAAAANYKPAKDELIEALKWTDIRKRIKSDDEQYSDYYLNV